MTRRLIPWLVVIGALVLVALGAYWTHEANRRESELTSNFLSLQSQVVARNVNAWKPEYSAHLQRVVSSNPRHLRVLLYDLSGWEIGRPGGSGAALRLNETAARLVRPGMLRPVHGEKPLESYPTPPPEVLAHPRVFNRLFASNILGVAWVDRMVADTGEPWLVATTAVNDYDASVNRAFISAWLQAAMKMSDVEQPLKERWWRWGGCSAAGLALVGMLVWWSTRTDSQLWAMAEAAGTISSENLQTTRLRESPDHPAAQRLIQACNRLVDRVAETHRAQQRFVSDAAHELRTPLTILRGEIQVALREPSNHPLLVQTLRSNLDESVHLSRLVDSLLTLARCDAGQAVVSRQALDLAALIRQTLARLDRLSTERRVELRFEPAEALLTGGQFTGDAVALERVVFNLVENAILHSPANHVVTLRATSDAHWVRMEVIDRGIGIGPEHLPRLFDRFYRVDAARRRADGGAGLGLAIVKTIVEAHQGKVTVRSEVGVGSTFTVELPRV